MNTLVRITTRDLAPHYVRPEEIVHVCDSGTGRQRVTTVVLKNGHSFEIPTSVDEFVQQAFGLTEPLAPAVAAAN